MSLRKAAEALIASWDADSQGAWPEMEALRAALAETRETIAVPHGLSKPDAEFWLQHRAEIIAACRSQGYEIVTTAHGTSLRQIERAKAQADAEPFAYLVVQASGYIVGGWKDRETAEKIAAQQLARDKESVVEVYLHPPRRESAVLSDEDTMVERAWKRFQAHVVLTDEQILALWSGSDSRPVLGKNKVLEFARAVLRATGGKE